MFGWSKSKPRAKVSPVTLQEQIDALEGKFRLLSLEWTDAYDKLYRLAGRMDASRRWAGEKPPPPGVEAPGKVAGNGSDELPLPDPGQQPPPVAKMSRSELLRSLTVR